MTNAQKWIAAFLGLFLLLFILVKVTKKENANDSMPQSMMEQASGNQKDSDGLGLIRQSGCVTCHGSELQGTQMAPALTGIKKFWNRDKLINYLRNPSSFGTDDRFVQYKEKYKKVMMPSYNNIDVKDLGKISDYLLSK